MAMSKTDFKNAFREVVSSEFAHIPTDENSIDFTFSERFNKRMAKLIRSQKKVYYNFVNTAYKRVAIICIILLTMLTTACSVKAIREPIVNFFTEVYETFTRYLFEGDTTDKITKEYTIKKLPDGFEQTEQFNSDILIVTTLENDNGNIIEFSQAVADGALFDVDSEQGETELVQIGGAEVMLYKSPNSTLAMWIQDEYYFTITCYYEANTDIIKQMIEQVE